MSIIFRLRTVPVFEEQVISGSAESGAGRLTNPLFFFACKSVGFVANKLRLQSDHWSNFMFHSKSSRVAICLVVLLFGLGSSFFCSPVAAQTGESIAELKASVGDLMKQNKYTEALPLLEKIVVAEPNDAKTQFYLGFALIAQANNTKDPAQRPALRLRARAAFLKAKELNIQEPLVDALISAIPLDGSDAAAFSENIAANGLMTEAEAFFAQGKLDQALSNYQEALRLDPKLYHAALFAGDVFTQKQDFTQALAWYDRAIAIDPNRETAYRYSATPLMKQGKTGAARDRYIEAFITEPYNKFARAGLIQWGELTKTNLAHPDIDIPTNVTFDDKGNANINLDASALMSDKNDGSFAWISYGATRSTWRKELFAKAFPQEHAYRHSLPEEVAALRSVITIATADKKVKSLSPSLSRLKKLNDEGLLESFILLAHADEGIVHDHPAYLKDHRDRLRRYVVQYVVTGGGNWEKF
jgi:tetratricopeptide (TPR) repeat protein